MYEATLLEVDSGSAALQDLQEQMEAVLDTLQRKVRTVEQRAASSPTSPLQDCRGPCYSCVVTFRFCLFLS